MKNAKSDEMTCFSLRLREYRRRLGMSQTELAARASLHRTYISELESGKKNPSLLTLINLADALQMETWQLLYFEKN